jgi:hypothetical protein
MKITFSGEPQELKIKIMNFLKTFGALEDANQLSFDLHSENAETEHFSGHSKSPAKNVESAKSSKTEMVYASSPAKKRGPKSKKETLPEVEVQVEVEDQIAVAPPTKDDCIAALKELNEKRGLDIAREVLTNFNCTRISELQPSQYTAFVGEIKAQLLV